MARLKPRTEGYVTEEQHNSRPILRGPKKTPRHDVRARIRYLRRINGLRTYTTHRKAVGYGQVKVDPNDELMLPYAIFASKLLGRLSNIIEGEAVCLLKGNVDDKDVARVEKTFVHRRTPAENDFIIPQDAPVRFKISHTRVLSL